MAPCHSFSCVETSLDKGGFMPEKIESLTTAREVEEAFIELFDRIDCRLGRYIGSVNNRSLKKQALRNTVGMLEILKVMYKNDLYSQR